MALFDSLSDKLQNITDKIRGKSRVTESDIKEIMREIRVALLEADVNYQVVKNFTKVISEKAKGEEVMKSLTPGQQIIKIVYDELALILGEGENKLKFNPSGFTTIMLYGLQGAGKTTTAAKLANILKKSGKKPYLVSVDTHRPAAQEQLKVLAEQIDVPYYIEPSEKNAVKIAERGLEKAKYLMRDVLIVDTAGRTIIDEEMMQELDEINAIVNPDERLLIVDAMIGQEAVNVALSFDEKIGLDGFIMTKLDGDARGGAALSIYKMTGKPIKYVGVGEKIDALEQFYPDRMAQRILGMGDVLTLIEKAEQQIDEEKAAESLAKIQKSQFTLDDMLDVLEQIQNMGSIKDILGMIPGMNKNIKDLDVDDKQLVYTRAIIESMTMAERADVKLLNASRRKRIAAGSGRTVQDVNNLVKQYNETLKMMDAMGITEKGRKKNKGRRKRRNFMNPFSGLGF